MKATVDIPNALYRQVKARAALEGRPVREVTIELYERWLGEASPAPQAPEASAPPSGRVDAAETWLAGWAALGDRIAARAVDPRTTREILIADRR